MRGFLRVLALATPVAACQVATPMTLPDGSKGQSISCHGALQTMAACYQKAGEVCPAGYVVIGGEETATPFAIATSQARTGHGSASGSSTYAAGNFIGRSPLVRCR